MESSKIPDLKGELTRLIAQALDRLGASLLESPIDPTWIKVERSRDASHGDYVSNIALRLAKLAQRPPLELAAAIVAALPASPIVARVEVAGAGFINFQLRLDAVSE